MQTIPNPQLELVYNFVQYTNKNIFLTGKAGTGKTTFLHNLKKNSPKRMVIVAPTGVAAINAKGVTMHSFFQIPLGPQIPRLYINNTISLEKEQATNQHPIKKMNREKINIIKSLDLLVIDEISMVRADLLDAVDEVLKRFRDHSQPFGGLQLLMIGDLQQLAPVAKEDEWEILKPYYDTPFFFSSKALKQTHYISIELKHIYRQSDEKFISILNKIRNNQIDEETLIELNKRYIPNFQDDNNDGYINLTTHNIKAQEINESRLKKIPGKKYIFQAIIEGDFPEYLYPLDYELTLKPGAQVMFVRNDQSGDKLYYNGKIGKITTIDNDFIYVQCPDNKFPIPVDKAEWDNTKYSLNNETKEIKEKIVGKFIQYPLKLAWAITIHKSQGLTFEKAIIDASASFAHGQVYVALSRCKSLDGLILSSPIKPHSIKSDTTISEFTANIEQNPPTEPQLINSKKDYQKQLLFDLFNFTKIQSAIFHCIKELKDNSKSILGNPVEVFYKMNITFKDEVMAVSEKFIKQIDQYSNQSTDLEQNILLQKRLKKACIYFNEKIDAIVFKTLESVIIETDNKLIKNNIKKIFEKLGQEAFIKNLCLKACKNGFEIKKYLNEKAIATIEKYTLQKTIEKKVTKSNLTVTDHPEIFDLIKKWRDKKATELNLPHYMILHQKAVLELSQYMPSSISQLKTINGFGKKKTEQFGEEIIELIKDYCTDHDIVQPDPNHYLPGKEPKPIKEIIDTKQITYEMYNEGKTVQEIAAIRGLVQGTIEGHLAHFIKIGKLEITDVIAKEKVDEISTYFLKNKDTTLTSAKEKFGNHASWGELKMIIAYLQSQKI